MLVVQETSSNKYSPRTFHNAKSAGLTIAFAVDFTSAGEKLTKRAAGDNYLAIAICTDINTAQCVETICLTIAAKNIEGIVLNIAGNSAHTLLNHGISQDNINAFLVDVISQVHARHTISKIVTGGQTGVDIAGAYSAYKCKIPVVVTMPKGFIQRNVSGSDVMNTKDDVEAMIVS